MIIFWRKKAAFRDKKNVPEGKIRLVSQSVSPSEEGGLAGCIPL